MNWLTIFVLLSGGLLLLSGAAVLLWRRFYRDDSNTARRIIKNSAVPFVARLCVRALDLLFYIVLYSTLPGAEIGPYTLAALLVALYLGTFTEFGLGVLLTREVARDPSAARRLFGLTLSIRWGLVLLASPLAALLLIGGYDVLAQVGGETMTPTGRLVIWILLLTLIPGAYSSAVTALYNASERMEVPALIELVTAIVSMLVRIGVLLLGFGIVGLAWAAVAVSTATALVYLVLQLRDFFRPTLAWDWQQVRHLAWLAFPLMLNNWLSVAFYRIDSFIIKPLGGGEGDLLVQQYAVPYQILNVAMILPPVITFAVFPLLARRAADQGNRAALAQAQNTTLYVLLLLACPIAMGMTVLAADLVALFTRDNAADYLPISAQVLGILAWFLPFSFVNGLLQYVLIAINRQAAITRAFGVALMFNLLANLLTIPLFGLYAASITTILSEVVLLAVVLPLLRTEKLFPPLLALAWRPLLAALAMGGAMLLVRWLLPESGWNWLLVGLVAPPVYALALWLLGAVGPAERALLRQVVGKNDEL